MINDSPDVLRDRFSKLNWNFSQELTHYGLHRLHWYPGCFIPQIPAYLIELFSRPGDVVYDPFCGSGASLVEALRLDRRCVGQDLNPVAVLAARAKTTVYSKHELRSVVNRLIRRLDNLEAEMDLLEGLGADISILPNDITNDITSWYHSRTLHQLIELRRLIIIEDGPWQPLLKAVFSQSLKALSSQRNHWGYIADNMKPVSMVKLNALSFYKSALLQTQSAFEGFLNTPNIAKYTVGELNARVRLECVDLLDSSIAERQSVDLIVTSPPYPNVTDYVRSQRLSYMWLGLDLDRDRAREIGARWKRGRSNSYKDYQEQMSLCLSTIADTLKPGGYMCLVVGEQVLRDSQSVQDWMLSQLSGMGLELLASAKRELSQNRLLARNADRNHELVYAFRLQT